MRLVVVEVNRDKHVGYTTESNLRRVRRILKYASWQSMRTGKKHLRVLDAGCGTGQITFAMANVGHEVTGVDYDAVNIKYCQEHPSSAFATFIVSDIQKLSLNVSFDMVICSEVLEHLPSPQIALDAMSRHLTDCGILLITVPNGYNLWEMLVVRLVARMRCSYLGSQIYNFLRSIYWKLLIKSTPNIASFDSSTHVNFFTMQLLKILLRQSHLVVLSVEKQGLLTSFPPLRRFNWCTNIEDRLAKVLPPELCAMWMIIAIKEIC